MNGCSECWWTCKPCDACVRRANAPIADMNVRVVMHPTTGALVPAATLPQAAVEVLKTMYPNGLDDMSVGPEYDAEGRIMYSPHDPERIRLADECGDLRHERNELLRENATLRRRVEKLERKR